MDVYPTIRYRNARAGIDWLVEALGFEEHMVVPGEQEGSISHAELKLGQGMVMVGDEREGDSVAKPAGAASAYLCVNDPDGAHTRAIEHGAEVLRELRDTPYGSREFSVGDPEGNVWSFGNYDPFNPPS
jgi:uncharacterized glyoxalase superfamily protein PhnB